MEKYTYEIRPRKAFNFNGRDIRVSTSIELSLDEAKTFLEKGKLYRIFPDITNSIKITKDNIEEMHREYFDSKPIYNNANTLNEKEVDKSTDIAKTEEEAFATTVEEKVVEKVEEEIPIIEEPKIEEEIKEKKFIPESLEDSLKPAETIDEQKEDSEIIVEEDNNEEPSSTEGNEIPKYTEEEYDILEEIKNEKEEVKNEDPKPQPTIISSNKNRFQNTQIMTGNNKKKHK